MEEELVKRNTDCVYFLASPFTCKKGVECEYRHCEMARLNPRDCWYWLSGSCLNPACAFRHPPMEVYSESASESASFQHHPSVVQSKNNVPCYFFYSGYCNKGDKCCFLHGPPDGAPDSKPKKDTVVTAALPSDFNVVSRTETESLLMNKCPIPSKTALKTCGDLQLQHKQLVHQPVINSISNISMEQKAYSHVMASDNEGIDATKSNSSEPAEIFNGSELGMYSDQSSEEQADGNLGRESSPGFDVLADETSENVVYEYEGDQEYMQALDEDHEFRYLEHPYVEEIGYDGGVLLRDRMRECSAYEDDEHVFAVDVYSSRDGKEDCNLSRKRKFLAAERPVCCHNNVDLRDHLRRRRRSDKHSERLAFRRHEYSTMSDDRRERLQMYGSSRQLPRRLASKVERNGVGLPIWKTSSFTSSHRGWSRNVQISRTGNHNEMERQPISSRTLRNPFGRRSRQADGETDIFTGPKTLAQIKEEKSRNVDFRVNFKGPKPLNEILKEKNRPGSVRNGNSS